MSSKISNTLLALLVFCLVFFPALGSALQAKEIVLVTTTDFHASLQNAEGLANAIQELRTKYGDQMVYADAGDLFQGSLEGNLSKGEAIVKFYNALKLDVAAIGNHEMDFGRSGRGETMPRAGEEPLGNLRDRVHQAQFAWLSSNWVWTSKPRPGFSAQKNALGEPTVFASHLILNRADARICFVGATTTETNHKTYPAFLKNTEFRPIMARAEAEAKYLRQNEHCDFVILVMHSGVEEISEGIFDAIVAGHTHLKQQTTIHKTPIIQAAAFGKNIGVVHLSTDKPARFEAFIEIESKTQNPSITALLKPYRDEAAKIQAKILGVASESFPRDFQHENALSNMVADALLSSANKRTHADFSLVNAGHFRADLSPGEITYGALYHVLPFDNNLTVAKLTGAEVKQSLTIALKGKFGLGAVSGLKIQIDKNSLLSITDNHGRPLNDEKFYRMATVDYLTYGGDSQEAVFSHIPPSRIQTFHGISTRDTAAEFIQSKKHISSQLFFDPAAPRIELIEK